MAEYISQITLPNNSTYNLKDSAALPLAGGNMTGTINRYYSSTSTSPILMLTANNKDADLWKVGHGTAVGSVSGNCYVLRYKGTNSSPNNYLQLLAGTSASPSTVVFQIDENGNITFPQINKGDTTTPIYFNNGVITEGTTIGASAYHDDSYFATAEHGNHVPAVQTANNITFLRNDNSWHKLTSADVSTLINLLSTGDSQLTANDYVITQYVSGGTTTTTYHRRKASNVVNATLVKAALGTVTTTAKKFLKDTGSWAQVDWGDLTGKPSTFSPSAHDHNRLSGLGRKTAVDTIAYNPSIDNGCRLSWLIYDSSSRNNDATNSPSFDASVLNLPWDWGGFNGQIAISSTAASNTRMQIRSSSSVDNGENANPRYTTNYGAWREVVTATKATKVGDTNKPVYIDATGQATAISYTIDKSVPSNAVFTDHYAWGDITSKPTTLSGYGITDAKIASGVITLGSSTITPVTSVNGHSGASVSVTASDLGLANALKYVGKQSALPTATDSATYSTYNNGDVITVSNKEYAYVKGSNAAGSSWVELGDEGSYKLKQTAFTNSTGAADGSNTSTTFIYSFSQDANGTITDIKTRKLPTYNNYSHPTGDGNLHVPATGTTNGGKFLKAGDTAGSLNWATLSKADISDFGSYLPLSGGTLTGALTTANNTWNSIGDDAYLGDINKAGHIGIQGKNGNTGIFFTTYNQSVKTTGGAITWNGTNFSITSTTAVDASISGNAATATTATNISYTSASDNVEYPILIKSSTGGTTTAGGAKFNSDVTINPSTSAITATLFKGTLNTSHINQAALVGTREVAGGDKGSSANPRYLPEKWKFNANITVTDGDIITIKTPGAGHDYGTYLSLDNGVNYYPIVLNTNGRYTTHFSAGTAITLRFDSSGSAASMFALSGQNNTTRVTVSGGVWRLLTVYDSGNTNDTSVMYIRIGSAAYKTTTKYQRYVLSLIKNETHIIPLNIDKDGSNHNGTTTNNHVLTTDVFDITSYIFVYNTNNASYAADATVGAGGLWYGHAAVDMRYSFNITTSTFTAHKNVYIKASLQSATTAKLCTEGNPVTQTLPSTKDNYIYILIGRAYNGYCITLFDQHPIYYYDGTTIREFSPINAIGTAKGDLMYWSAANLPVRLALGTTGHFLKATDDGPAWSALPTASTSAAGIIQIGTGSSNAMAGNTVVNKVKTTAKTDNVNYKLLMSAAGASPTSGSNYEAVYDANITVNPSTHTITATTFSGALSGNASTATTLQTERKIWGRSFSGSADVTGDLDWDSQTYRQRIHITDDSTADTAVFTFQQSEDSGSNYLDLFTIKDNGNVIIGRRLSTAAPAEATTTNRITIIPYYHTGGPWYIASKDDSTYANLTISYGTTERSDFRSDGRIYIYANVGAGGSTNQGILNIKTATTISNGSWSWGVNHIASSTAAGGNTCLITGVADNTNNAAVFGFHYAGNNNANNYAEISLVNNTGLLKVFKSGQVEITTTTDATSTTTGVLKVAGGISVAKAIYMGGQLTIDNSAAGAICMTRTSGPNWIWANNASTSIAFCVDTTLSGNTASLKIEKTSVTGYNNNYADLGTSSVQWKSVHSYKYIVEEKVTLQWNATDQSLDFVFA